MGVISNPRSHRNRSGAAPKVEASPDVVASVPRSKDELVSELARLAAANIELLVIDGGDGTVRDVLSALPRAFARAPRIAVLPSGKTNALALDLGIPAGWSLDDALAASRTVTREPVEVLRAGQRHAVRGFLFGTGGFVRATALAQRTHKAGAFNSLAVGLSLGWAVAQTLAGGAGNPWRRGEVTRIALDSAPVVDLQAYMVLASTLERLPTGVRPFGAVRRGLKLLTIEAPPRALLASLPSILNGRNDAALARHGYHRLDAAEARLAFDGDFVLDGETFAGGEVTVRRGAPIHFLVP